MISYPAIIKYDNKDKVFYADFPDLRNCHTYGRTLENTKEMAKEVLTAYLEALDLRKMNIPEASKINKENIYYIEPETTVAFAIWLKKHRKAEGLTQADIARKLGVKYQTYQKFENPSKTNPRLKTIIKLQKIFNQKLVNF